MDRRSSNEKGLLHASLSDVLRAIRERVEAEWGWPSGEGGFTLLLYQEFGEQRVLDRWRGRVVEDLSARRDEAPVLAACGYAVRGGLSPGLTEEQWREGVRRLSQRDPVSARRDTFLYRPLDVLGIALGIAIYEPASSPTRAWFAEALARADLEGLEPVRTRNLLAAAASAVGEDRKLAYPEGGDLVELAYWWVLTRTVLSSPDTDEVHRSRGDILRAAMLEPGEARSVADEAAVGAALASVVRAVVEAVVEEFEDPEAAERRRVQHRRLDSLEGAVTQVNNRAWCWGRTYTVGARLLLLPLAFLVPAVTLFSVGRWFVEKGLLKLPLPTVIAVSVALAALAVYMFVRDWEKSPANVWPRKLGRWKEKQIRRRWLGENPSHPTLGGGAPARNE